MWSQIISLYFHHLLTTALYNLLYVHLSQQPFCSCNFELLLSKRRVSWAAEIPNIYSPTEKLFVFVYMCVETLIFDILCFLCTYGLGNPDSVCPLPSWLDWFALLWSSSLMFFLCWHFLGCSIRASVTLSATETMAFHKEIIEFSFPSALKFPWPFWLQHLTVLIFYFWNQTFHPGPVSRVFYFCHWCQTPKQECWEPALAFPPPLFPFFPLWFRGAPGPSLQSFRWSLSFHHSFQHTLQGSHHHNGLMVSTPDLFHFSCGQESWVVPRATSPALSSLWLPHIGPQGLCEWIPGSHPEWLSFSHSFSTEG